jgi:hypothetical protein
MAESSVRGECLNSGAVNRICDAHAGANGNSAIVLDHGAERLPVADIRQPIVEAIAKEMPIPVVDRHCAHIGPHVVRECENGTCPEASRGGMKGEQFEILGVEARPFALSPTDGFLRAHGFEALDEIVGQIGAVSPETLPRRSHQVETRGCTAIPLIDGHQASAAIAVVQGSEAPARKFRGAVGEVDHSQRMLNSSAWDKRRRMSARGPLRRFAATLQDACNGTKADGLRTPSEPLRLTRSRLSGVRRV